jgi:GMP synthase-like glutamine amidotransferase
VRILAVRHEESDPPQIFGEVVRGRGHELDVVPAAEAGSPEPYDGVIVLGGTMDTHEERLHPWLRDEKRVLREALDLEIPIFGICLGGQLLAEVAGASVGRLPRPEIGWYDVELTTEAQDDPIFSALPDRFESYQWHNYAFELPDGAVLLARGASGPQAYRLNGSWGVQFHPEVDATTLESWIEHYDTDANAQALGLEAASGKADARSRIARWNEIGRTLCSRFLDALEQP